jgi:hypothetical protein
MPFDLGIMIVQDGHTKRAEMGAPGVYGYHKQHTPSISCGTPSLHRAVHSCSTSVNLTEIERLPELKERKAK